MRMGQMQTWEHKVIHFSTGLSAFGDKHAAEVERVLSDLGREGWEVVACVAYGAVLVYTLKRPKG